MANLNGSQKLITPIDDLAPLDPNGIEAQVGNTPLINLTHVARRHGAADGVELYGKAEWFNPTGSVKDRPALHIIRMGEHEGKLRPGMTLLDSTSGNMGIAYAMFGAARGYKVKLAVPANASPERIKILRAYGAEIVLTDPLEGSDGAILEARQLAAEDDTLFYLDQYNNPANWQAHYWSTAPEIWHQTAGRITHFVAGLGTSGTFTGITRRLKAYNPAIQCIAAQPNSPFNGFEGWKYMATSILPGIYDLFLADRNVASYTEAAYRMAKELARADGLFVSPSSAGSVATAIEIAKELDEGVVVTVMADNAYKYLSERFWDDY
jgi:cysteine synthase B